MGHAKRRAEAATWERGEYHAGLGLGWAAAKRKRPAGALGYGGERKQATRGKRAGLLGP